MFSTLSKACRKVILGYLELGFRFLSGSVGLGLVRMFYFGLFNIGRGLLKTFGSALGTVWVGAIFISRPLDADFMHDFRPFLSFSTFAQVDGLF